MNFTYFFIPLKSMTVRKLKIKCTLHSLFLADNTILDGTAHR